MSNRKERIMTKLSELVDLLIEEKEISSSEPVVETEESKKEKPAKEEKAPKTDKVYSKANPPKGAKEVKNFHENIWAKLSKEQQQLYIEGKIDSTGATIEAPKEEKSLVSKEDVKVALIAFNEKNGDEKTVALLKSFGASKFSELTEDKYVAFIAATEPKEEKGNLFD